MKRGFKAECESNAIYWRTQLNMQEHSPLLAEDLATYLGITVLSPKDIPGLGTEHIEQLLVRDANSWSAVTLSVDDVTIIIHNSTNSLARKEADLMHELSHVILEHKPYSIC